MMASTVAVGMRRCFVASVLVLGFLAALPGIASAGVGLSTTPSLPAIVTVGDKGVAASLTLTNNNTSPDVASIVCNAGDALPCPAVDNGIALTPSCAAQGGFSECTVAGADPGVFQLASTPTGAAVAGNSCAGMAFDVAVIDVALGKLRLTPLGGAHVTLPAPGAFCRIDFTFDVLKTPAIDAQPDVDGVQTITIGESTHQSSVSNSSASAAGASSPRTTVLPPGTPPPTAPNCPVDNDDHAPDDDDNGKADKDDDGKADQDDNGKADQDDNGKGDKDKGSKGDKDKGSKADKDKGSKGDKDDADKGSKRDKDKGSKGDKDDADKGSKGDNKGNKGSGGGEADADKGHKGDKAEAVKGSKGDQDKGHKGDGRKGGTDKGHRDQNAKHAKKSGYTRAISASAAGTDDAKPDGGHGVCEPADHDGADDGVDDGKASGPGHSAGSGDDDATCTKHKSLKRKGHKSRSKSHKVKARASASRCAGRSATHQRKKARS